VGVFIGCSPFYGLHLMLCWVVWWLLRLNRLKMYLAANVSNPFLAPFLVLAELQVGAWIRRGELHPLTIDTVRSTDPWVFGADLLVGSVIVGGVLGVAAGLATWLSTRDGDSDPAFSALVRRASDRYVTTSITAWEFARGKLRGDPLYRTVLTAGILPSGGGLADIGCGQALMLALLAEAADDWRSGTWPASLPSPPVFDNLVGIELRPRVASIARRALAGSAEIIQADARHHVVRDCTAVLLFDVLHLMPAADQDRLLRSISDALAPGGVILVREADAGAGWRFQTVRAGNRLKALIFGRWGQRFHFRSAREWTLWFERAGFHVARRGAGGGTPFGNVLFVLTRPGRASA
jgi:SAM-dependent methyltransferase